MKINEHVATLESSYLFSRIRQKVKEYKTQNPGRPVTNLGIGDVTLPLVPAVVDAMTKAVSEMGVADTFRGYCDEQGYLFLRQAVCDYYVKKDISLHPDEVFISDGAKSDLGNILDVFARENRVLIPDPVYPVYVDTNVMAGREIVYIEGTIDNGFLPMPDWNVKADIIYLCSPNNPTGAVYNKEQLETWVEYALENSAVILFDSAYEAYIQDKDLPTSIYEIDRAQECAIEFCSLSKTAGFTGVRCGYTVVPLKLVSSGVSINKLWLRRQTTKFNGVPYIVQRGAQAVFSEPGLAQIRRSVEYYMENARLIAQRLAELGIWYVGGDNAPYLWLKCPDGMSSWTYFDYLLSTAGIIGTPGAGFGLMGEGFFRFSSFGKRSDIITALQRL